MAKGNLFLGYGRGKVGDVVFSRQNGEQVTRARNRAPRNPQSALQMLQRVCMKTNSTAYSMLSPICDHAFQGFAEGTECQSRFAQLNIGEMRNQLRLEINAGDTEAILTSQETNFSGKADSLPQMRSYIVSEGTIAPLSVVWDLLSPAIKVTGLATIQGGPTYQQVVDALGLQKGDQLTFITVTVDDRSKVESSTFNSMKVSRIILEPTDGDMTSKFLSGEGGLTGSVNKPNAKNDGNPTLSIAAQGIFVNEPGTNIQAGAQNSVAGFAVIASRLSGGVWQRSTQRIEIPSGDDVFNVDHYIGYLQDAIYSYLSGTNSTLYLNQAE